MKNNTDWQWLACVPFSQQNLSLEKESEPIASFISS